MLRSLAIRNFVVVESLELELDAGFSVFTGETGAGKSILLDALALLLGDRFETRQLRPGSDRAELSAVFDATPAAAAWLEEQAFAGDDDGLVVRRVLDAQGKSRAWINGRAATLGQLADVGTLLIDLHGQHAHQTLLRTEAQRDLLDAYAGLSTLALEVSHAWRAWKDAVDRRDAARAKAAATASELEMLRERQRELAKLELDGDELTTLTERQSRLAHAATLIATANAAEEALSEGDDAIVRRLRAVTARLVSAQSHDSGLAPIVALLEPASIQIDEAARELRAYRDRLDLDPASLREVEARLGAIHDMARKHRVRPEALPALLEETEQRLHELEAQGDESRLATNAEAARAELDALAMRLSAGRVEGARALSARVSAALQDLAMQGGRLEVALQPLPSPTSHGNEQIEFQVAAHPQQPLAPLSRVASGGELSRLALALQVATSEVAGVPTLIFDEVDAGIGGTVAATVGRLMQSLGAQRQVLCVTHLPQVAAFADAHFRVVKQGDDSAVRTEVSALPSSARIEELARMLAGSAITAKTRAHARELLEQHRRSAA